MHASSFENMYKCFRRYIDADFIEQRREIAVLDIGGADLNGSYRDLCRQEKFRYTAADLVAGPGVSMVLDDPYVLPVADSSVDIVMSGQMLEHCEYFWRSFEEMVRVVKEDGFIFLIAPSSGPIHRYPVDCYRYHPDAFHALARYAKCNVQEVWMDERGPWNDLVGVFRKGPVAMKADKERRAIAQMPVDVWVSSVLRQPVNQQAQAGQAESEVTRGDEHYLATLARIHAQLQPASYLEIGVRRGHSMQLAQCPAVGVDPDAEPDVPLAGNVVLYPKTSDEFFDDDADQALKTRPDLVFIDGMHLFEFALRDFMHAERFVSPAGLIVIDDIFPNHRDQASRDRRTRVWCGDVWKLYDCLRTYRPDLVLIPLDCAPTGLLLIAGLDDKNRNLWTQYNPIVRRYAADTLNPPDEILERAGAMPSQAEAVQRVLALLKDVRSRSPKVEQLRDKLRETLDRVRHP